MAQKQPKKAFFIWLPCALVRTAFYRHPWREKPESDVLSDSPSFIFLFESGDRCLKKQKRGLCVDLNSVRGKAFMDEWLRFSGQDARKIWSRFLPTD